MPNPFPGMNPYLENPRHWRGVHLLLLSGIHIALNRVLPPEFAPRVEERVFVEGWRKDYYPDNLVLQVRPSPPAESRYGRGGGGTAVLDAVETEAPPFDNPLRLNFNERTVREAFLEIRTTDDNAELIAVIEILSPTNKEEGPGRDSYRQKQRDLMYSTVHLIEIDLLRAGQYTVAPEEEGTRVRAGHFDYIISLHRGATGNSFEAWTRTVRERLPRIRIPLTEEAGDVYLDIQEILNRAYDDGGLGRTLRYDRDPIPPLTAEDSAWAENLLREQGLR
ncbi:MAG: DUF4058 family protein [Armatimonadaceae bacterium]